MKKCYSYICRKQQKKILVSNKTAKKEDCFFFLLLFTTVSVFNEIAAVIHCRDIIQCFQNDCTDSVSSNL